MKQLIILIIACIFCIQSAEQYDPQDMDPIQDEIRERWDQFIIHWEAGDAEACSKFYTVNGMNIPPDFELNASRESIEAFYSFLFSGHQKSKYYHSIIDLSVFGNEALEYGEFSVDWTRHDGTEWSFNARSLTHWVLSEHGEWEIEKFMFNRPPDE